MQPNGNGVPQIDQRVELERRVLGAAIHRADYLAAVQSILGDSGEWFTSSVRATAYEAAARLGAEVSLFGVLSRVQGQLGADSMSAGDMSQLEDYAVGMTPSGARGLARELVRLHHTARAVSHCVDVTEAVRTGVDYAESMTGLLGALDAARGSETEVIPRTLAELRRNPPVQPEILLGDGILSRGEWMLLHARENVGKTWGLGELANALVYGRDWYGIPARGKYSVGAVFLESSAFHFLERLTASRDGMVDLDDPAAYEEAESRIHVVTKDELGFVDLSDPTWQRWIYGWCSERKVDVLLLDPLSHFLKGEEDREGVAPVLRFLEGCYRECGATPVLSHHDRKSSTQGDQGDHGSAARGSITIMASARSSFRMVRKKDDESCPIELICDKASNGPKPHPIHLRHDEETGRLVVTSSPQERGDRTVAEILSHLEGRDAFAGEIALAVGRSTRTVERRLRQLEDDGFVRGIAVRVDGSRNRQIRWTKLDGENSQKSTSDTSDTSDKSPMSLVNPDNATHERHGRHERHEGDVAGGSSWEDAF